MADRSKPTFFKTAAAFRSWLEKHHDTETELWIGYYKKASGKGGMVYKEALDEALCYGWIDGLVQSVDGERYRQRWTPRRKTSHWSLVNVRRMGELEAHGRLMHPGRAAFALRTPQRTGVASYENPPASFTPTQARRLKANRKAWEYFQSTSPNYQRVIKHWVTRAKRPATRERRLTQLIDCSAKGERVPPFISPPGKT